MKIRYFIPVILLTLLSSFAGAQSISRSVISITGESVSEGGYYLSYSTGEAVVSTRFGNMRFLTQGFQQPVLLNKDSVSYIDPLDAIDVFPNPVDNRLTVSFRVKELTTYYVHVYDISGRILIANKYEKMTSQDIYLDFSQVTKGLYFVHVYSSERKMDRVFKIEKL